MGNRQAARFGKVFKCLKAQWDIYLQMLVQVHGFLWEPWGIRLTVPVLYWCHQVLSVPLGTRRAALPPDKGLFINIAHTVGLLSCVPALCFCVQAQKEAGSSLLPSGESTEHVHNVGCARPELVDGCKTGCGLNKVDQTPAQSCQKCLILIQIENEFYNNCALPRQYSPRLRFTVTQ